MHSVNRRRVSLLIICILLGAILNIAVAWSCAIWSRPDPATAAVLSEQDSLTHWHQIAPTHWVAEVAQIRPSAIEPFGSLQTSFGMRIRTIGVHGFYFSETSPELAVGDMAWHAFEYSVGWPIACLHFMEFKSTDARPPIFQKAWVASRGISSLHVSPGQKLPYGPIWIGLVINTIFYAAVAWLVLRGPSEIRRRIRQYRGRCQACGYPIGLSSVCTECGVPVPRGLRPVAAPGRKLAGGAPH